ncbi:putative type IIS restriction /modification enzyme, N-terminal half [Candidatus Burkholderia verschuerenii]|uniref:site-specific DNA-methyltransferase (adenine-specific) n=1 Tax=Candidatus Burkholderia verschuerenii TaxID=242163 RepID=A0A0L0MG52_9BURK|nr:N-6 DNA methylase [Candidatus Burkholderia verschuerenii]KND61286.1 putative type IIS restriction /modification enzyme, N-terminal half [Candidatus Burkholderia verschuerenii]
MRDRFRAGLSRAIRCAWRDAQLLLDDADSCAFVAIELNDSRALADIARRLHRVFAGPLVVIFRAGTHLSFAFVLRASQLDDDPHALEKVTMLRDVDIADPHIGHLDVIASLVRKTGVPSIDVERLSKRFYRDIANWYGWALQQFDLEHDEKHRATALIRLLTRMVFCRFLKEQGLLPAGPFHEREWRESLDLPFETSEASDSFPDHLFFEPERGLLRILDAYKFTLIENTPVEEEMALDPELLGKVFENLLASYNNETRITARKQTGSFYTPRPIVDYMADASLKLYLADALKACGSNERDIDAGLDTLFAYTERVHPFSDREVAALLDAIRRCRILDPACGSGAFPMGVLHKLVHVLRKLDPHGDDYHHKRHLIENCLYGVDIQPLAIQISKLRMMISLLADDRALSVTDTKFTTANALIDCDESFKEGFDIVIGNPPYYKENDDKRRFDGLRDLPCYQGKMDVWYLFADAGLDMLKPRGVLSFIATNNWTTNAGASKLLNRILRDAAIVDFEHHRIFEDASIQTMIMTLRKDASSATYRATVAKAADDFTKQDMSTLKRFHVDIDRVASMDKPLSFNPAERTSILDLIAEAGNFRLLKSEIAQGIVPNPDRVNARNIETIGAKNARARGIAVGDGVFVLNERECASIDRAEQGHLKPLYEPVHIGRYVLKPTNLKIIYAKKGAFDATRAVDRRAPEPVQRDHGKPARKPQRTTCGSSFALAA